MISDLWATKHLPSTLGLEMHVRAIVLALSSTTSLCHFQSTESQGGKGALWVWFTLWASLLLTSRVVPPSLIRQSWGSKLIANRPFDRHLLSLLIDVGMFYSVLSCAKQGRDVPCDNGTVLFTPPLGLLPTVPVGFGIESQGSSQHWKKSHYKNAVITAYRDIVGRCIILCFYTVKFYMINLTWP